MKATRTDVAKLAGVSTATVSNVLNQSGKVKEETAVSYTHLDFSNMYDGQARYSPMCNENGGVIDDLIVYKIKENYYFIVVNASNREKDFSWMKEHQFPDANFEDLSDQVAQIALQGPRAHEILTKLVPEEKLPKKYYSAVMDGRVDDISCIISKTGYTGEDGYELYMGTGDAGRIWDLLLDAGRDEGLIPCGLGARDTLRLEAAMPLYGHEKMCIRDRISSVPWWHPTSAAW